MTFSLPKLARRRMEDLKEVGLPEPDSGPEAMPEQGVPSVSGKKIRGVMRPVHLKDGRKAWLWFGTRNEGREYRPAQVFIEPPKTDRAILAALTVLEGESVDPKRVCLASRLREALMVKDLREVAWETTQEDSPISGATAGHLQYVNRLDFPVALLRYYRRQPDLKDLPEEKRTALLQGACRHINELLKAARNLQQYLEFGGPAGRPNNLVRDAEGDIRAAELKGALGLSHRRVGEMLGVTLDQDYYALKGSNKKVEDKVRRGRKLLIQALGEEGYTEHLEAVKPHLDHWYSLIDKRRWAELVEWLQREFENQPNVLPTEEKSKELDQEMFEKKLVELYKYGDEQQIVTFEGGLPPKTRDELDKAALEGLDVIEP
jgi:hypothetical protein